MAVFIRRYLPSIELVWGHRDQVELYQGHRDRIRKRLGYHGLVILCEIIRSS